jgi:3-deoxy-7-phosphoheptulonate synthase
MVDVIEWDDELPAAQQPVWPDAVALEAAVAELRTAAAARVRRRVRPAHRPARRRGARAGVRAQGGDCAETFDTATAEAIRAKLKTVLQMAIVLTYGASLPVVKIGRIAGQYGKPRSNPNESRGGVELASYFGDGVNAIPFDAASRTPDPQRLLKSYHTASATLNLVRAFTQGGYADLRQVHAWNQDFVSETPAGDRYEQVAGDIDRALSFMPPAAPTPRSSAVSTSTRATRRSPSTTSGRSPASTRARATSTTCRGTWSGSGSARASSTALTSTSRRASATRSE